MRLEPGRALLRIGLTAALASCALACEPPQDSGEGAALFARHCASCHGAEGDGAGPLAGELNTPPADLRTLAKRNGGRFDENAVMAMIDGRRAVSAHGPRDMPVWGAVFESEFAERGERLPHYTTLLRARLLADYLRTIQTD